MFLSSLHLSRVTKPFLSHTVFYQHSGRSGSHASRLTHSVVFIKVSVFQQLQFSSWRCFKMTLSKCFHFETLVLWLKSLSCSQKKQKWNFKHVWCDFSVCFPFFTFQDCKTFGWIVTLLEKCFLCLLQCSLRTSYIMMVWNRPSITKVWEPLPDSDWFELWAFTKKS